MILISGASGGVARALVPQLAEMDEVIGLYRHRKPAETSNPRLSFEQVDLTDSDSIRSLMDRITGRLSRTTVVHLAATKVEQLAVSTDPETWQHVLSVNLTGSFRLTQALLPLMIRERWGRIVHVSSASSHVGSPGTVAYSASKAGLEGMSRVLAKEYGRYNITSNVLVLGYMSVGLIDSVSEKVREELLMQIPARRFGDVANVAHAVEFLMKADFVNGASIRVDGGI